MEGPLLPKAPRIGGWVAAGQVEVDEDGGLPKHAWIVDGMSALRTACTRAHPGRAGECGAPMAVVAAWKS